MFSLMVKIIVKPIFKLIFTMGNTTPQDVKKFIRDRRKNLMIERERRRERGV